MKYEPVITPLTGIARYRKDIQRDCVSRSSKADDTGKEQNEYIHDGGGNCFNITGWLRITVRVDSGHVKSYIKGKETNN